MGHVSRIEMTSDSCVRETAAATPTVIWNTDDPPDDNETQLDLKTGVTVTFTTMTCPI